MLLKSKKFIEDIGDEDQQRGDEQQALAEDDEERKQPGEVHRSYSAACRVRPEARAEHSAITADARAIGLVR